MEIAEKVNIPYEREPKTLHSFFALKFHDGDEDLIEPFTEIVNNFPRVILASKSIVRKQQLIDSSIPFEVIVSNADETPDVSKTFKDILAEISMRKAQTVMEMTKSRGLRIIVAADQNIVYNGIMYGKPKSIDEARKLLSQMRGKDDIYAYTGNSILLAKKDKILQSINLTDVARLSIDNISDEEMENYLKEGTCLSCCGGITMNTSLFVHLKEGRLSTAKGMTIEYLKEMLANLKEF